MNFYGQRNPLWADVTLGNTKRTIAQVGCTTCCVADAASYFKCDLYKENPMNYRTNICVLKDFIVNPPYLAKHLSYTSDARILWKSVERETCFKMTNRFYGHQRDVIARALDPKNTIQCVTLNVDNGGHWVFALRALPFNRYWVSDPWTNTKKIYGGVVGGAVFTKK